MGGAVRRCHLNEITVRFYRNKMSKLRLFYVLNFVSNGLYSMFSASSHSLSLCFCASQKISHIAYLQSCAQHKNLWPCTRIRQ